MEFLTKEYEQTGGRFQPFIDAQKNNFSLHISQLFVNDSNTYYCAARHSDAHKAESHTNIRSVCHRWQTGRSCGLFAFYNKLTAALPQLLQ